jgi:hypothetical protein
MLSAGSLVRIARSCIVAAALACCGGGADHNPLVGTWRTGRSGISVVAMTLVFGADRSVTLSERVEPFGLPAGVTPSSCVTTRTFTGTYSTRDAGTTLVTAFTGGTANVVSGCPDPASNAAGTPLNAGDIVVAQGDGEVPPTTVKVTVSATKLVVSPADARSLDVGATVSTGPFFSQPSVTFALAD